jgi:hypothetical protein
MDPVTLALILGGSQILQQQQAGQQNQANAAAIRYSPWIHMNGTSQPSSQDTTINQPNTQGNIGAGLGTYMQSQALAQKAQPQKIQLIAPTQVGSDASTAAIPSLDSSAFWANGAPALGT